jgi:prefoldin subunit 5
MESYQRHVNEELQPDLTLCLEKRQSLLEFVQHAEGLMDNLPPPPNTLFPIGSGVFLQATMDTALITVNIGLDTYVECTKEEAQRVLPLIIAHKQKRIGQVDDKIATIRAHIHLMGQLMDRYIQAN